jgi:23S rRNA (uracil1939-C5)-methyltransferase
MIELHPHGIAHGGEAVARKDGKAHFVAGAMPGEVVTGTVIEDKGSWARVALVDVLESAPERRQPPCIHADLCGGCQWQFAGESIQRSWKRATVISQLQHLGRVDKPVVHETVSTGSDFAYRNRMDFHVVDGKPALYRSRSNDLVPLSECLLLAAPIREVFDNLGDLTGITRLILRAGINTDTMVALIEGEVPDDIESWGLPVVHLVNETFRTVAGDPNLSEVVDGVRFEIPAEEFFQNNTAGAEVLVSLVRAILEVGDDETMLDGYCGVGLFGATVGRDAARVVGVESSPRAAKYARRNLTASGVEHNIKTGSFSRDIESLDEYWDVAVVDPPRKGLGEKGVQAVTSAMPRVIAYVSCDPASFARDTKLLSEHGYEFVEATPVDMFPQTYHVEVVGRFDRMPLGDEEAE